MKFVLCDIDGTFADSRHRSHLLPAIPGAEVTRRVDGVKGVVRHWTEAGLGETQATVTVEYQDGSESVYRWDAFMEATNAAWGPWHAGIVNDTPIDFTITMLKMMRPKMMQDSVSCLWLTSRHESSRQATLAQLHAFGATYKGSGDILEMRPENDPRKDTLYKGAVLDRYEAQGHNFIFALEDRKTIATFLRARGIPTLHVADAD